MRRAAITLGVAAVVLAVGCATERSASPRDAGADAGGASEDATLPAQSHDAGVNPGKTCNPNHPFDVLSWAPPSPFHQGVCTATDITTYIDNFYASGPFTSGDATCDACLQTDVNAAAHGPVVTTTTGTTTLPSEINYGGCIAMLDGCLEAGCCGDQFDDLYACWTMECDNCSDWQASGPATIACLHTASMGECSTERLELTASCENETLGPEAGIGECSTLLSLFTNWCGP
jgi:hypothetical protein